MTFFKKYNLNVLCFQYKENSFDQDNSKTKPDVDVQSLSNIKKVGGASRRYSAKKTFNSSMCDICGKWFAKPYTLERHRQSIHLHVRYTCNICGRSYCDMDTLKKHIKTKH